jgi:dsDNA-specific endonuclease/ATPase MutS2
MLWLVATVALLLGLAWLGRRLLARPPVDDPVAEDPGGPDPDYEVEIGDELDLHGVPPRDVAELVDAFVDEAARRGLAHVRIVHGKGIGALRQIVHARLARHPAVRDFGEAHAGGWGATRVELAPPSTDVDSQPPGD